MTDARQEMGGVDAVTSLAPTDTLVGFDKSETGNSSNGKPVQIETANLARSLLGGAAVSGTFDTAGQRLEYDGVNLAVTDAAPAMLGIDWLSNASSKSIQPSTATSALEDVNDMLTAIGETGVTLQSTFDVPTSGKVLLVFSGYITNGASSAMIFGARIGTDEVARGGAASGTTGRSFTTWRQVVDLADEGYPAGTEVTVKAALATFGANVGTLAYGNVNGQATFEVYDVPFA